MEKVELNKEIKLTPHFTLGELTKTKYVTADGNIPSRVVIENLIRVCGNWLEELRARFNRLYSRSVECGVRSEEPIVINSGYRSLEVNRLAGDVFLYKCRLFRFLACYQMLKLSKATLSCCFFCTFAGKICKF